MDVFIIAAGKWRSWKSEYKTLYSSDRDVCLFLESMRQIEKKMIFVPHFNDAPLFAAIEASEKEETMQKKEKRDVEEKEIKDEQEKRAHLRCPTSFLPKQTANIKMEEGTNDVDEKRRCITEQEDSHVVRDGCHLSSLSSPRRKDVGTQLYTIDARTEPFSKVVFRHVQNRLAAQAFAKQVGIMGDVIATLSKDLLYLLALLLTNSTQVLMQRHPSASVSKGVPSRSATVGLENVSGVDATPTTTLPLESFSGAAVSPSSLSHVSPSPSPRTSSFPPSSPLPVSSCKATTSPPRAKGPSAMPPVRRPIHSIPRPIPSLVPKGRREEGTCGEPERYPASHSLPSRHPVGRPLSCSGPSSALRSAPFPFPSPSPPSFCTREDPTTKDVWCFPLSFSTLLQSFSSSTYATLLHFLAPPWRTYALPLAASVPLSSFLSSSTHAWSQCMQHVLQLWATERRERDGQDTASRVASSVPAVLRKWVGSSDVHPFVEDVHGIHEDRWNHSHAANPAERGDGVSFPGWVCQCCRRGAKEMFHYDRASRQLREVYAPVRPLPSSSFLPSTAFPLAMAAAAAPTPRSFSAMRHSPSSPVAVAPYGFTLPVQGAEETYTVPAPCVGTATSWCGRSADPLRVGESDRSGGVDSSSSLTPSIAHSFATSAAMPPSPLLPLPSRPGTTPSAPLSSSSPTLRVGDTSKDWRHSLTGGPSRPPSQKKATTTEMDVTHLRGAARVNSTEVEEMKETLKRGKSGGKWEGSANERSAIPPNAGVGYQAVRLYLLSPATTRWRYLSTRRNPAAWPECLPATGGTWWESGIRNRGRFESSERDDASTLEC